MGKEKTKPGIERLIENVCSFLKAIYCYLIHAGRKFSSLSAHSKINILGLFVLLYILSVTNFHFWMMHKAWPMLFSQQFVRNMGMISLPVKYLLLSGFTLLLVVKFLGWSNISKMKAVTKGLKLAGLKNAGGIGPRATDIVNLSPYRQKVSIDSEGVPLEEFERKKNFIRSCVNSQVEAIIEGDEPKYLDLYLTNKLLPKRVSYGEVCSHALKPGQFVIGKNYGQVITQNLFDLPHMLVAGSTGMGKSYFLRQMLLNLLENTPDLQVYALDFKEGISMKPFRSHPRVRVIKDVTHAITILEKIESEMKKRFKILEETDADVIDPKVHKRDPILVLIDECSMLYSLVARGKSEKESALKATQITDNIAKLSRAARIHLVLGTQKITKETVSTHIQENIEGRVCFKVTSIQGSALVIGNKAAKDLPKIPGRAISKVSVDQEEVQTPFITTEEIKQRVARLKEDLDKGKRKPNQEMVSEVKLRKEKVEDKFAEVVKT